MANSEIDRKCDENILKCDYVILKAKRELLVAEELGKIANITLSNNGILNKTRCDKSCTKSLNWKNYDDIWKVPNPKTSTLDKRKNTNDGYSHGSEQKQQLQHAIDEMLEINRQKVEELTCNLQKKQNANLTKKYFFKWKESVQRKNEQQKGIEEKVYKQEKLDKFIQELKKQKEKDIKNVARDNNEHTKENDRDIKTHTKIKQAKSYNNFQNRFCAQKTIIEMQRAKIEEQNKIIAELELGIIREDLMKSIENTKTNIRDIFAECSHKIKLKMPTLLIQEPKFSICSKQAPKFVQQMEERALIRARNREMILERKRFIEETRQKLLEEAIEKKKALEEEECKRNLEMLKEKRKKEMELERIRQANHQIYLKKLNCAIRFHNKLLMEQCFKKLTILVSTSKEKHTLAVAHHRKSILRNSMRNWIEFIEDKYRPKFSLAEEHYRKYLLKMSFFIWKEVQKESIRNSQVAEDYYEFKLTSTVFIYWHRYTCKHIMLEYKKIEMAEKHYKKKIVFHYFYQWRSLKMVLELEKARELKKRRWREKVWEILPDYKPPIDV